MPFRGTLSVAAPPRSTLPSTTTFVSLDSDEIRGSEPVLRSASRRELPRLGEQPHLLLGGPVAEGRATRARDSLHVEDLFYFVGELQRRDRGAGAEIDDSDTAPELIRVCRDRYPTEDDALTDLRQPHEGQTVVERQASGVPRKNRDVLALSGGQVHPFQAPHAGV